MMNVKDSLQNPEDHPLNPFEPVEIENHPLNPFELVEGEDHPLNPFKPFNEDELNS